MRRGPPPHASTAPRAAAAVQALERLKQTIGRVRTLGDLHRFLFVDHAAYNAAPKPTAAVDTQSKRADGALAATY